MEIHAIIDIRLKSGTAQGEMLFWDDTLKRWVNTENSELFWDDTSKRLGVKTTNPSSALDVNGTVTVKRILAGGVTE